MIVLNLPAFHAPNWTMQLFLLLVALGFPVTLVLGWVFEVSNGSLRRTTDDAASQRTDYRRLFVLGATGLLIAGIAVASYAVWHPWRNETNLSSTSNLRWPESQPPSPIPEKSVAVLPFDNLSDDNGNAHFAEGVHDEILTDLAKVSDLKVISRTSTMQYRSGAERNLREIGRELGAAHIVEGTVQRVGDRVRVSAQLIDARTDAHLWAEHYDRDLSNVFALESDLAETIVEQLRSKLSPEEKAEMEVQPTADSVAHDQIYLTGPDHTPGRRALADEAIKAAQRLRPDAGETHLALAEHLYCGYLAYDEARRELEIARQSLPNEPVTYELEGYIDRRQGRWDASTRNLIHALELDPRNAYLLQQLAVSYQKLRRYDDAAAILDRALHIRPDDIGLRVARAGLVLHQRADPHPLHATIEEIVSADPEAASGLADEWLYLALCERDSAAAERAVAVMTDEGYNNEGVLFSRPWCRALVARTRSDSVGAQTAFMAARDEVEQRLRDQPDQSQSLCVLGMIDAALGHKADAIREGRRAAELLPLDKDSINGALAIEYLAVTYAWTGEKDQAIEELTRAATTPSDVSYGQLRLHPFWDSLRGDPRFEKIVASLAPVTANR
ncbi:MAG: tetratricopeptide repeat protein [Chthoniobacterales bacterium]